MTNLSLAFLNNFSPWEIGIIFLTILLLFGAKRIPELARSLGRSIKEFKKATSGIEDDIRTAMDEEPTPPTKTAPEHTVTKTAPEAEAEPTGEESTSKETDQT